MTFSADLGIQAGVMYAAGSGPVTPPFTWLCWVERVDGYESNTLVAHDATAGNVISLYIYSDGKFAPSIASSGGALELTDPAAYIGTGWQQIAFTWAANGDVASYVGATQVATANTSLEPVVNNELIIGGFNFGGGFFFPSATCKVSLPAQWTRVLTPAEIATLAAGGPPDTISTGLARYWENLTGAGPHAPRVGSGNLVEYGTVTDAASDPPSSSAASSSASFDPRAALRSIILEFLRSACACARAEARSSSR